MYIGHQCAGAISDAGAISASPAGRRITAWFSAGEGRQEQFSLFAGLLINVLVLAIGVPLILLTWGFQWGDLQDWAYDLATEIRIGSISISIVGILTGIALFLVGYFFTRSFQRWLDGRVMMRGGVDAGVRNSISTIVGYAGVALAALFGLSVAGLNLSSLALVAGALSVGIGFGLQNIVNNFVSGLILLAERPFKVGDWIVAGDVEGTVRKISVRATEVETFQRQTVILPNSDLINSRVRNWTHRNRLGRVDIPVSVGAECDPRKVYDTLLEIARTQPSVLKNPSPFVALTEMTPLALNFSLRFYLADIANQLTTTNEIRFRIVETFKREGIK
jgi:potassium-dependent mechanosensitive channel